MIRSACSVWTRLAGVVGIGTAILLASGCDTGGSKRDSLYQQLVGAWTIQDIYLDGQPAGGFNQTEVRLEFLLENDERSYRLTHIGSSDTTTATGGLRVLENNVLSMTGAFSLVWRFDFDQPDDLSDSVRFQLERAGREETESFLNAIGLSGRARSLTIDLVRESE